MADDPQGIKSSFTEKMRLIRFRRKRENLRFWSEFKLVPAWLIWTVFVLYVLAVVIALYVNLNPALNGGQIFPPDLKDDAATAEVALALVVTGVSLCCAIFIFLTGYVYRDAKRRGMNAGLWTLLVVVLMPSSLVIGFVIYFLMREPLPFNCPQCGATVGARFNFCPNCKYNLHPACPNCKREVGDGDKFCAYCGQDLGAAAVPDRPLANSPS
jgi:ABC-type Fe3+ transport system permease subunit